MTWDVNARIVDGNSTVPVLPLGKNADVALTLERAQEHRLAVLVHEPSARLLRRLADAGVVAVLAAHDADELARECERAGAALVDDAARYASPALASYLYAGLAGLSAGSPLDSLSDREREVLTKLAQGASNRDIGAALFVSEHTVRNHLQRIYRKLGVRSRKDAVAVFRDETAG